MDNVTIIQPEQRDSFGPYRILPGHIHVFAFTVPLFGSVTLEIAHVLPNSQDFSLDFWISEEPLDGLLLQTGFGHFRAKRRADRFEIFDSFLRTSEDDERLFLDSHKTCYINAKNLQNRHNTYELTFETKTP